MKNILVTGASGFVGQQLCETLKNFNYNVYKAVRKIEINKPQDLRKIEIGKIDNNTDWSKALKNIDCVIHCAGRAHRSNEQSIKIYHETNVEGTKNLAEQCVKFGVKRFIFLSTIKVNGEKTEKNLSFKHDDLPFPTDEYGVSKWQAEKILKEISKKCGLEIVIIRSPLVYGPGVKGNFLRLMNLTFKKIPLPISKIDNLRSFVGIENLIDLIICCIKNQTASGKIFLVSDCKDVSTPELIAFLGNTMKKSQYFIPMPIILIKFLAKILNKSSEVERLTGNLQVDCTYTCEVLNWKPPVDIKDGLRKTVEWYLKNR
ncbi:NAD-dependent epimerase/dehydratase family protein [Candidatus Pelagibacter bacterium]|nr:NAD-dependent epimerase/dehydratase family protein [Candidatus Pelagibacter bacterium]